jgi:cardiolipin synthase A/B
MYWRWYWYIVGILVIWGFVSGALQLKFWNTIYQATSSVYVDLSHAWEQTGLLLVSPYFSMDFYMDTVFGNSHDIILQTYDITHPVIKDHFITMAEAGTELRIMVENKKYMQYYDSFVQLSESFSWVAWLSLQSDDALDTSYLHSKYVVWDSGYVIQTANLTKSAFSNREFFRIWWDAWVKKSLLDIFHADREDRPITANMIHPSILICPINCRNWIEKLLESAQQRIWIHAQYIVDQEILAILENKLDLDLRMIVANTESNEDLIEYFGPQYARILPKPYNHSKAILVDDSYLLIGSINLSDNSMDNNRELSIIINDPKAIQEFTNYFVKDWTVSTVKI